VFVLGEESLCVCGGGGVNGQRIQLQGRVHQAHSCKRLLLLLEPLKQ
jgi:hypothetical protein